MAASCGTLSSSYIEFNHFNRLIFNLWLGIALHPELKSLYIEPSEQIQKRIKAVHVFLVNVIPPVCALLSFVTSFYTYFSTELGDDAFEFLYPIW